MSPPVRACPAVVACLIGSLDPCRDHRQDGDGQKTCATLSRHDGFHEHGALVTAGSTGERFPVQRDGRSLPRRWRQARRRQVKVHGLMRTGTNYVSALLGENLDIPVLGPEEGGWKHGPIEEADDTTVVVVVKNPYTWLESFYKWELRRQRTEAATLTEFALSPVSHRRMARVWGAVDPIDAWNKANASWLQAERTGNVLVVRYEDVIADIGRELDRFTTMFPTQRRHHTPVDITSRVGPGWKTVGPVDREHYMSVALPGPESGLVALLDGRVDQDLMRALRYAGEE